MLPASRAEIIAIHGEIVDRVLRITGAGLDMEDTFFLRFDVMIFFVSDVLRHLHDAGPLHAARSQLLWDVTFEGLEESLRDRGVSDIRLAARMRKLLQNALGRRNAYLAAWAQPDAPEAIRIVMARNILNGASPTDPRIDTLLAHLPGFAGTVLEAYTPVDTTEEKGETL